MLSFKIKKYKNKWLKQYKKKVLLKDKSYHNSELSVIYDFDSKIDLYCLTFYDCLDNNELNMLINKLYKLKKNDNYDVDVSYRKKRVKNLNYIKPEFDSTGNGSIARIKLLNDDLISAIDIIWTQVNNDEATIEYICYFKKSIHSFDKIHNFVTINYNSLKKIEYADFYFNIDYFIDDDRQNIDVELNYFRVLLQNKISNLVFSHYITKYLLPIKYTYIIDKQTTKIMEYLKTPFLEKSYILDKNHYIVVSSYEELKGTEYNEFIFKNRFNPIDFINLLSRIRMPFYYEMFYQIEKNELQSKIINYLNSKRRTINFSNYKWLLNKRRRIEEKRFYSIDISKEIKLKEYSNSKYKFIDMKLVDGIKNVYDDNIEFIKNINILNYNIIAFVVSALALLVAIITLWYTVLSNNDNVHSSVTTNNIYTDS